MIEVLVVEDEKLFRDTLVRRIEAREGFKVVCAVSNGIEGLMEIDRLSPQLIFSDIRMPGMDGLSFLEQIRKDHGDITVIFISGYSEFEFARRAVQLGAFDYLLKPLEDEELDQILIKARERLEELHMVGNPSGKEHLDHGKSVSSVTSESMHWTRQHLNMASLNAAAEQVRMNPAAFSRKFKQETGTTFIKYLTELRMQKAVELLANPVMKILEISEEVGYVDQRHFTEVFKKQHGMSPQDYRKQVIENLNAKNSP